MAVIHDVFLGYISNVLSGSLNTRRPGYECDPLFALLEECRGSSTDFSVCSLSNKKRDEALKLFPRVGVLGTINNYFRLVSKKSGCYRIGNEAEQFDCQIDFPLENAPSPLKGGRFSEGNLSVSPLERVKSRISHCEFHMGRSIATAFKRCHC